MKTKLSPVPLKEMPPAVVFRREELELQAAAILSVGRHLSTKAYLLLLAEQAHQNAEYVRRWEEKNVRQVWGKNPGELFDFLNTL
mgnify:CR=1 FL=1